MATDFVPLMTEEWLKEQSFKDGDYLEE